jgi:hypothetical protein
MFAVAIKPVLELFSSLGLEQWLLEQIGSRGGDALWCNDLFDRGIQPCLLILDVKHGTCQWIAIILRSKLAKDMMCMLRFHLSKEFSKKLTLRERETKEHNASACINKITPGYSQPSWNAIKSNCNIANLVWESMTKLTLAETLHFNVIVMWCSVDPALNNQVSLAWHPPHLHEQTLVAQVAFNNFCSIRIVTTPIVIIIFRPNTHNESATNGAFQNVLQNIARKLLLLARYDWQGRGILRESIKINITELAHTSSVDCLLLFLGCPCCQKVKVQLYAKVGVESFHLGDWVHVLLSPPGCFMIDCMWAEEPHKFTIKY